MNTYKLYTSLMVLFLTIVLSCNSYQKNKNNKITHKEDYENYLQINTNKVLSKIEDDIDFWTKKYKNAPNQLTYLIKLSGLYSQQFDITGNIDDLYTAEKMLLDCNNRLKGTNASIQRSIAKNYISQHRFKEALKHLQQAFVLGENKKGTLKMLFDVHMELGNYKKAKKLLTDIQDFKDFDYLIRLAKWNDHIGNLDDAINVMEKAMVMVEESNNKYLKTWIYSNIADFYGHAGRINDSYEYYLKTLALDANNMYALKGIAWIAFSHERNVGEALEILSYIEVKHPVPDIYLLKAEINEYAENQQAKQHALNSYFTELEKNNYGEMYNSYNALLFAETPGDMRKALQIAKREIENRPTANSYDLLAWTYYNMGEFEDAYAIAKKYTLNKSHEPLIVYHNQLILKANNKLSQENSKKRDLVESIFELGPNFENQIKSL